MENRVLENRVWVSFEDEYPSWNQYFYDKKGVESLDDYINNLISAIEWCCNKKVKALKIESVDNKHDPIYHVVKNNKIGKKEGFKNGK